MSGVDAPARWRAIAERCRTTADGMLYSVAKRMMLEVAASYEVLAEHAEFIDHAKRLLEQNKRKPD
jgi:hypothetical protein